MRVAILSAEAVPYSKTGGLGDVAGALPKALRKVGVDAFLITPCYLQTKVELLWRTAVDDLKVSWGGGEVIVKVLYSEANGAPTFLIDHPALFHRESIYGFREDHERFAFFCKAAIALMRRIGAAPDIVHLNDWHCGFAAVEIAVLRGWDSYWKRTRMVHSIHNLAYQGIFDAGELPRLGFTGGFERDAFAFEGSASALKAGLEVTDMISTVSRRYGHEIQTEEYGNGLEWLLRNRAGRLSGIVNGIDFEEWNPATDRALPSHFSLHDIRGKAECKRALLERFSLPVDLERPILASITRLTPQKGVELMMTVAEEVVATGAYLISLGSGESKYEDFWQRLRDRHPGSVGVYRGYNEELAHLIEAGADIFLMPSKFEPCGLNQMYSLRYGTVPVVRSVGGLDDTVEEFDAVSGTGNGFKFHDYRADQFLEKIYEALFNYGDPETWRRIQWNGMSEDNSWERAAHQYVDLYRRARSV